MQWTDDGLVLGLAKHGESSAIVDLLTRHYGRYKGLMRGATAPRMRGVLQPGNLVTATWKARLPEHLGTVTAELSAAHAAKLMARRDRLGALSCLCAMASLCLPEREPHPGVYEGAVAVIELMLADDASLTDIGLALVHWELGLLGELGYGLDLSACAVTGQLEDLAYVSPKSARAVSRAGAGDYADRLLPLPPLRGEVTAADVRAGFHLTGYFLDRNVLVPQRLRPPPARDRFVAQFSASGTTSGAE